MNFQPHVAQRARTLSQSAWISYYEAVWD